MNDFPKSIRIDNPETIRRYLQSYYRYGFALFFGAKMNGKFSTALALGLVFVLSLAGCQKTEPVTEGPAEKVGQKLDQAASKAAVHINAIAEKAGQGLAKAGEKMEQKAKEAQEKNNEPKNDASK